MNSTRLNLFQIARDNVDQLDRQLSSALSKCGINMEEKLRQFMEWVFKEASVSVNLSPSVLACFLQTGVYLNIHEWALEQETLSGRSRKECLRERLGTFYDRRTAFDGTFQDGEHFQYGALNAGGPGFATKFGMLCIVLDRKFVERVEVAYLPEDSLAACFYALGELDLSAVRCAVAPHSHRHVLATIKHFDAVPITPYEAWATLVLGDSGYIEAIFQERFSQKNVSKVRIRQKNYDELWDLAFSDFGKKLSTAERALVLDFTTILKESRQGSFVLEVLS